MAGGNPPRRVVQIDAHAISASGFERLRLLMAVAVSQVEQSIGDAGRRTAGVHVRHANADERLGSVRCELELGDRSTENDQRLLERLSIENERATIIVPLIRRKIRVDSVGTPFSRRLADRLRRAQGELFLLRGRLGELAPVQDKAAGSYTRGWP